MTIRADRDEHALVLFTRMLTRRPVWVDSPANQQVWITQIGLDDDGEVEVWDHEGQDRRAEVYQLAPRDAAGVPVPPPLGGRVSSRNLRPGTRLRWTGTPATSWSEFAVLERRKSPDDRPRSGGPFLPGWWCEGGGGLADFVIDNPDSKWVIEPDDDSAEAR